MRYVLVCWIENESSSFVVIETDNLAKFVKMHDRFINIDDGDEDILNEFYTPEGEFKHKKSQDLITNCVFDLVIRTGQLG